MFGAGHIADMVNRMKQNRSIIPSKRGRFKEDVREGIYSHSHRPKSELKVPKRNKTKVRKVIQMIRIQAIRTRRKNQAINAAVFIVLAICLVYFIFLFS